MIVDWHREGSAEGVANDLEHNGGTHEELTSALINALLRIDTLERQVETLSKDLARVALSKRKYVSDANSNEDQL